MQSMDQLLINSCRICRTTSQVDDFLNLYAENNNEIILSISGEQFVRLLGIEINIDNRDYFPKYLCKSCDLQLELFKKLKARAEDTDKLCSIIIENLKTEETTEVINDELNDETNEEINENDPILDITDKDILVKYEYIADDDEHQYEESDADAIEQFIIIKNNNITIEEDTDEIIDDNIDEQCIEIIDNVEEEEDTQNSTKNDYFLEVDYLEEESNNDDNIKNNKKPIENFFKCFVCKIKVNDRNEFLKHRNDIHNGRFPCSDCPNILKTNEALRIHKRKHRSSPNYQCDICQKLFSQKVHFQYHMNKHNNIRNFKCSFCDGAYLSKADLNTHMRCHTGERPHKCDECGKTYSMRQHLKMHIYSHSAKQFQCEICAQMFVSPVTLRTHLNSIHAKEPRFSCNICGKNFRRKHQLVCHHKVHTNKTNNDGKS